MSTINKVMPYHPSPPTFNIKVSTTTFHARNVEMMARAQKPDFVFRRNGRVHLNRRGRQFSRLLAAEV
jgi:CTP-dependent riboflavin kinase